MYFTRQHYDFCVTSDTSQLNLGPIVAELNNTDQCNKDGIIYKLKKFNDGTASEFFDVDKYGWITSSASGELTTGDILIQFTCEAFVTHKYISIGPNNMFVL